MTDDIDFKLLTGFNLEDIAILGQQLNLKLTLEEYKCYLIEMFKIDSYVCFGVFLNG